MNSFSALRRYEVYVLNCAIIGSKLLYSQLSVNEDAEKSDIYQFESLVWFFKADFFSSGFLMCLDTNRGDWSALILFFREKKRKTEKCLRYRNDNERKTLKYCFEQKLSAFFRCRTKYGKVEVFIVVTLVVHEVSRFLTINKQFKNDFHHIFVRLDCRVTSSVVFSFR